MKKRLMLIPLLVIALIASLGVSVVASPGSYSTDMGRVGWGGSLFDITAESGLNWGPLEVDVSYADGQATFVITPPVAFNPETWVNDNFWLVFDVDNDSVADFQVLYNTGVQEYPESYPHMPLDFHWAKKTHNKGWSDYQVIPEDWDVSETDLEVFTVSIPVSYLGGPGSNYGFLIGLVKYVHEDDWLLAELPSHEFDPSGLGWSTGALIFVPLPGEGYQLETVPTKPARSPNAFDVFVRFGYDSTRYDTNGALRNSIEAAGQYNDTQYMLEIPAGCVVEGTRGRINWLWLSRITDDVLTFSLSGDASFSEPCTLYVAEGDKMYQDPLSGIWIGGRWKAIGSFDSIVDGEAQLE